MMHPLLEIRPGGCLFIVGPQMTGNSTSSPARLSYFSVIRSGLAYLKELGIEHEGCEIEALVRAEPLVAMQRTTLLLKTNGIYDEWRKITFSGESSFESVIPDSVQWLLKLHEMGAMLACTQYDTLLDAMVALKPATICSKDPAFSDWLHRSEEQNKNLELRVCERERATGTEQHHRKEDEQTGATHEHNLSQGCGFLHLHGVQTLLDSICLFPYSEMEGVENEVSAERDSATVIAKDILDSLRDIFRNKLVFLVGFDGEYEDPLLLSFLRLMYPERDAKVLGNLPILLTSSQDSTFLQSEPERILQLRIPHIIDCLREVVLPGSPKNFSVGKEHAEKNYDDVKVQAFLLFNEKQSFRKLGEVIYQQSKSGEIYVRRDALTVIFDNSRILYGNLVTYGGSGLIKLWDLVFAEGSTPLGKGLLALGLQSAAIVWINNKPEGLGDVTGINSVHTFAAHKAVHKMAIAQGPSISSASRPPFFIPVSVTPPTEALLEAVFHATPPDSRTQSPEASTEGAEATEISFAAAEGNSIFSFACALPRPPAAVNPFAGLFLPGLTVPPAPPILPRLTVPPAPPILPSQYSVNIPPTPTLTALSPNPFSLPILPTSVPISILPSAIPLASPHLASFQASGFQFPMNPQFPPAADLQTLTNLQHRINKELNSTYYSGDERNETNSDLDTKVEQGVILSRHNLLVAKPAEFLSHTPGDGVSLQKIFSESEQAIEYIDTQDRLPSRGTHTNNNVTSSIAAFPLPSCPSLSTAVKFTFTNTAPLLSLLGGTSRPIHFPGLPPSPILPKLPFSPLRSSAGPAGAMSPTNLCSSLLPLLYAPVTPPTAGPATSPHQPAFPNFYFLPTSLPLANAGASGLNPQAVNLLMGKNHLLNLQQLPSVGMAAATTTVAAASSSPNLSISWSPFSLALPQTVSSSSTVPPSFTKSLSVTTPAGSHESRAEQCRSDEIGMDRGSKQVDYEDIGTKQSVAGQIEGVEVIDDSISKKRKCDFQVSTEAKLLKLSLAPDSVPPPQIRGITTNQNHPSWSGDTIVETHSSGLGTEIQKNEEEEDTHPPVGSGDETEVWQFLLDLLLAPNHGTVIQWTGRENEFQVVDLSTLARLWQPEQLHTSLEKFKDSLVACCAQGVLQRVEGRKLTYKFLINVQKYIIEQKSNLFTKAKT